MSKQTGRENVANMERKTIQEGITLIKQIKEQDTQNKPKRYLFSVEVEILNTIEFIADFSGSQNVKLMRPIRIANQDGHNFDQKTGKNKQAKSAIEYSTEKVNSHALKQITIIQPYSCEIVAELELEADWKIESNLKYIIKPAPKEKQRDSIRLEEDKKKKEIKQIVDRIKKLPLSLLTTREALQLLKENLAGLKPTNKFIDPEFLPIEYSIFGEKFDDSIMDTVIQWRRPTDFFRSQDHKQICIFKEDIKDLYLDIIPGQLGDFWILSALATLAERPELIQRLFLTQEVNDQGFYRVKICKNGEWQTVFVDDYFPCNPLDGPIFSFAEKFQIWVLILEKAYAKLHGNYFALKDGFCEQALMDLTGCPVEQIDLIPNNTENQQDLDYQQKLNEIWKQIKNAVKDKYIMNIMNNNARSNEKEIPNDNQSRGLQAGHAYAIIDIQECQNVRLINVRDVWEQFKGINAWHNKSSLWNQKSIDDLKPKLSDPKQFWISLEDLQKNFNKINVCMVKNWDEVRVKGKFVKVEDINDPKIEIFMSKWYYQFEITEQMKNLGKKEMIITLHQEDEMIRGVQQCRPYLDISLACFQLKDPKNEAKKEKKTRNNENYKYTNFQIIKNQSFVNERQIQIKFDISMAGVFIILPRTNGLRFKKKNEKQPIQNLMREIKDDNELGLTEIVESTIVDIFRKFDMLLTRKLTYRQFKAFIECMSGEKAARDFNETEFESILSEYPSFELGISQQGFLQYWRDKIKGVGVQNKNDFLKKFEKIGYDQDSLHSVRSRCFILSIHFDDEIEVVVRDAVATDFDLKASRNDFFKQVYGKDKNRISNQFQVEIYFDYYKINKDNKGNKGNKDNKDKSGEKDESFTAFYAINQNPYPCEVTIDFSQLKQDKSYFSSGDGKITKRIEMQPIQEEIEQVNAELLLYMKGEFNKQIDEKKLKISIQKIMFDEK